MKKEKTTNNTEEIKTKFFTLSICKDHNCQPYLNVFHFQGENFDQKKLGEIFGVIKINDYSENSAYIANIITQVFKKEFYKKPAKANTEKNLEEALHRSNLALADLSRYEIIEWMGKLNAVVGVVKKNQLIFSCASKGVVFLIRDKKIVFIQDAETEAGRQSHPIKTFSELSSGKINPGDKIIITTEAFLKKFPPENLERHAQSLTDAEFENLICSTLKSESDNLGLIIINALSREKTASPVQKGPPEEENEEINFFGDNSVSEKLKKKRKTKAKKIKEKTGKNKLASKIDKFPKKKIFKKRKKKFSALADEIYMSEKDSGINEDFKKYQERRKSPAKKFFLEIREKIKTLAMPSRKNKQVKKIKKKTLSFKKSFKEKISKSRGWTALKTSAKLIPYKKVEKILPDKKRAWNKIKNIPVKIRNTIRHKK